MHQSLLAYAGSLNQTSRGEWKKIEGRFRSLRFVEDSQEIYSLAADLVSSVRRPSLAASSRESPNLKEIAEQAVTERWFDSAEVRRVERLLGDCRPVTAAALQALPRVVARLGQNERSLFAFIQEADLDRSVGTTELYESFAGAMRSDIGVGGTHRRWVETEDALARVNAEYQREALTAACLLQLGVSGERRHLSRTALELAVQSRGADAPMAAATVQTLIDRRLLIHRRANDDVSIWHGADVDLATKVRLERSQHENEFDLVSFLNEHHPAPVVHPTRHNAQHGVARYFVGRYIDAETLLSIPHLDRLRQDDQWGTVYFVLAETPETLAAARKRIEDDWNDVREPVVFAIPRSPIPVKDAALEVVAISALRNDGALLEEDPLVTQDLEELSSIARRHLQLVLHQLVTDRPAKTVWLHAGTPLPVNPEMSAGIALSDILNDRFHLTPKIANEQVMRNSLTRQIRTAQVRLILRIMEHGHRPNLGYSAADTSAEASLFRTVLQRTGLHCTSGSRGRFGSPREIRDPGLREAWSRIQTYFTMPADGSPKQLSAIVQDLRNEPIGLPHGTIPILVMAGYKAFARAVSLRTDGTYVPDILGFEASKMFVEPERHTVTVHNTSKRTEAYLQEVAGVFSGAGQSSEKELLRLACDAVSRWKANLPPSAWQSPRLSAVSQELLDLVRRNEDLPTLLLDSLPLAFGTDPRHRYRQTIKAIVHATAEIADLTTVYTREAIQVIGDVFSIGPDSIPLAGLQNWLICIDVSRLLERQDLTSTDKAVLRNANETLHGSVPPERLARNLSSILLQRGIDEWHEPTIGHFRRQLRDCRQRIENAAIDSPDPGIAIAPILEARIRSLQAILATLGGHRAQTGGTHQ